MKREIKSQIAFEFMILLGVLTILCFITKLWSALLLIFAALPIIALRMMFLKTDATKKAEQVLVPTPMVPEPVRMESERDIHQRAFGLLQRRISERLVEKHANARWVWSEPDAISRFINSEPLSILLNGAGGYRKAKVITQNLSFVCLSFESAMLLTSDEHTGTESENPETESAGNDDEQANYELLAFEWTEKNLLYLNEQCNSAIAKNQTSFQIPSDMLPCSDSWPDVCEELLRNGFDGAEAFEDGIQVGFAQHS